MVIGILSVIGLIGKNGVDWIAESHRTPVVMLTYKQECEYGQEILSVWRMLELAFINDTRLIVAQCDATEGNEPCTQYVASSDWPVVVELVKGKAERIAINVSDERLLLEYAHNLVLRWEQPLVHYPILITAGVECESVRKLCKRLGMEPERCVRELGDGEPDLRILAGPNTEVPLPGGNFSEKVSAALDYARGDPLGRWDIRAAPAGRPRLLTSPPTAAMRTVLLSLAGRFSVATWEAPVRQLPTGWLLIIDRYGRNCTSLAFDAGARVDRRRERQPLPAFMASSNCSGVEIVFADLPAPPVAPIPNCDVAPATLQDLGVVPLDEPVVVGLLRQVDAECLDLTGTFDEFWRKHLAGPGIHWAPVGSVAVVALIGMCGYILARNKPPATDAGVATRAFLQSAGSGTSLGADPDGEGSADSDAGKICPIETTRPSPRDEGWPHLSVDSDDSVNVWDLAELRQCSYPCAWMNP